MIGVLIFFYGLVTLLWVLVFISMVQYDTSAKYLFIAPLWPVILLLMIIKAFYIWFTEDFLETEKKK